MADTINKNTKVFELHVGVKNCREINALLESLGFKNPYDNHGVIEKPVIYLVEVEKKIYYEMQILQIIYGNYGPRVTIKELREWVKNFKV